MYCSYNPIRNLILIWILGTTNGFNFQIIDSLIESRGVRLTWFDCNNKLFPNTSTQTRTREQIHEDLSSYDRAVFNWASKVISRLLQFCITVLCDWLTKLTPLSQPMGIQTKTNRVLAARVFPRLAPVTCIKICFEFWLARCVVYICCDWLE